MKNHCTWIFRPFWPFLTYPKQIKNQKTCKIDQKVVIFRGLGILHFLKKYRKFKSKLSHIIWIVPKNLWARCYIAFTWKIFSSLNLKCQFWPLWLFFCYYSKLPRRLFQTLTMNSNTQKAATPIVRKSLKIIIHSYCVNFVTNIC